MIIGHARILSDFRKLAQTNRLSHGYIFFGPSMVGKRTVALGLASYLETGNLESRGILQDCLTIEPDADGKIGIDSIRPIKGFLWQRPIISSRRTLVLDRAELLTAEAQNALLKITEEPPSSTLFILVTNDLESLNPTILSRLYHVFLPALSVAEVKKWLVEALKIKTAEAERIASESLGKPGLAAAIIGDKKFNYYIAAAEKLLKVAPAGRREFIKKLMDKEDFNFPVLLDAVILRRVLLRSSGKSVIPGWHELLDLRRKAAYFNLNPRLQIEGLLS
ncbi:MAG: hypothetical protein AAB655_02455 [Patescibacteria group bacterium]